MKYKIYVIKQKSNDKVLYVGKTVNFERRKYDHTHFFTNTKDWLRNIGVDNVYFKIVAEFDNKTEALKHEDELILRYNTLEHSYNKQRSGLISVDKKEYEKEYRQREVFKEYQKEYQKEYHQREVFKEYQKEYRRKYYNTENQLSKKKKYSEAHRDKAKAYAKEYHRKHKKTDRVQVVKRVICIETGEIFESLKDVQRKKGYDNSQIGKCCRGKASTSHGFHWKFE